MRVVSFQASGEFASFRDPSVTTNQTVYYIPSKSAVIGLLGAVLGIERGHGVAETYNKVYLQYLQRTRIGIRLESDPEKVSFFTNHRSLKEAKIKPFKTELLIRPRYRVFVASDFDESPQKIYEAISNTTYIYPPYLGHVYCHATLSDPIIHDEASEFDQLTFQTSSVVLDESETYDKTFSICDISAQPGKDSRLIIERHLHHYVEDGKLTARVLKHWIPVAKSFYEITLSKSPSLSKIIKLGDDCVCLY